MLDADAANPPNTDWLEDMIQRVAHRLRLRRVDLSVVIVDDALMARMHEEHCGVPGTTDVITFDLSDAPPTEPGSADTAEGELYLCLDEATRVAARRGHPVDHELLLYATHGLLHLLGYDDHEPSEYDAMHAREDELLNAVGVGAVFHAKENPST